MHLEADSTQTRLVHCRRAVALRSNHRDRVQYVVLLSRGCGQTSYCFNGLDRTTPRYRQYLVHSRTLIWQCFDVPNITAKTMGLDNAYKR